MQPPAPLLLEKLTGKSSATVGDMFRARAEKHPDQSLLIDNGLHTSYGQAWDKASRAAGFIAAQGLAGQQHCVSSFLSHRSESLWPWLGCQLLGTIHCYLNWEHRGELLLDMLTRTRATLLVTEAAGWELFPTLEGSSVDSVLFVDEIPDSAKTAGVTLYTLDKLLSASPVEPAQVLPSDISALIFSSGSTGRSKAVQIPHNMLARGGARMSEAAALDETDVIHFTSPLYHIAGQLHCVMLAIASGSCLALYPRFSRSQFWRQVSENRVTYMTCFSNVMRYLLSDPEKVEDQHTTLRTAMIAQAGPTELKDFSERFNVTMVDSYGMTEGEPLTLPDVVHTRTGSCGPINPDFEIAILDDEDSQLPTGQRGRIAFRPNAPNIMMSGYAGAAEDTVKAWHGLWFHTQDIGYVDEDNFLYYVERLKFTIRRKGENIIPAELESVVRHHPEVEDCVAVGVATGPGEQDIKLIVSTTAASMVNAEAIKTYCEGRVARFMQPQIVEIVTTLPYTPAGKIDRIALS